jgi:uncharacterized protein (DUF362 family)/NAD-dependent dihydropyrimidine dehydrogenase PreA subunit
MKAKVAIVECPNYKQNNVDEAVKEGLKLIGGLSKFVKPNQKVLIKVNALMDSAPEQAATTHPALVSAIVKEVVKLGAKAYVGDSPGNAGANIEKTMEKTGFTKAAQKAGGEILNFHQFEIVDIPSPSNNRRVKQIKISKAVLDVDIIINLPKLKTHTWTLFTGAIKNLFGVVPGFFKSKYHIVAPQPYEFSKSLVDIFEIVKPQLNIMDGIEGMEGPGPSAGNKRFMGALFFSSDAVAMDAVCSEAINYRPFDIDTTKIAHRRNLGIGDLNQITILGTSLEKIRKNDWKHFSSTNNITKYIPSWLNWIFHPITKLLRINPVIDQEKCTKCLVCAKNCPAKTINLKNREVRIDLKECIMCYCCSELCPYKAISLKRSWLAKRLGIPAPE